MLSFKFSLVSTVVLSSAILLKFTAPAIAEYSVYDFTSIYSVFVSWLRPPYLYLLLNCIIISIFASSKLQSTKEDEVPVSSVSVSPPLEIQTDATVTVKSDQIDEYAYDVVVLNEPLELVDSIVNLPDEVVVPFVVESLDGGGAYEDAMSDKENEFVIPKSNLNSPDEKVSTESSPLSVKSPVSVRFGTHRRNAKSSPEVLGVSKSRKSKQDTLESTWKTITEGRSVLLSRHLQKSDTWSRESQSHQQSEKIMTKSETFATRTSPSSSVVKPPRREPSLSQDELNKRVEAFINKFNEEMRLQRQESLKQYGKLIGQ